MRMEPSDTAVSDILGTINLVFILGCFYILLLIYKRIDPDPQYDEELSVTDGAADLSECEELNDAFSSQREIETSEQSEPNSYTCEEELSVTDDTAELNTENREPASMKTVEAYYNDRLKLDTEWLTKRSQMIFGNWASEYSKALYALNENYST